MVLQCLKVTCQALFVIVMQVKLYVMNQVSLVVIGVTDPFKGAMKSAGLKALKFYVFHVPWQHSQISSTQHVSMLLP